MVRRLAIFTLVATCVVGAQISAGQKASRTVPKRITALSLEEVAWDVMHGVVAVVIPEKNRTDAQLGVPVGTAFFVSDEYVATNAHVIREAESQSGNGAWALRASYFDTKIHRIVGYQVLRAELVDINDSEDVALLKLKDRPDQPVRPFVLALGFPTMGTPLAFAGFGLLVDHPLLLTAFMASQGTEHFAIGLDPNHPISKLLRETLRTSTVWVIDRSIPGGFSGSPVFLRTDGVVYGICSGSTGDVLGGVGFVHSLQALSKMLTARSISFKTAAPQEEYFPVQKTK